MTAEETSELAAALRRYWVIQRERLAGKPITAMDLARAIADAAWPLPPEENKPPNADL